MCLLINSYRKATLKSALNKQQQISLMSLHSQDLLFKHLLSQQSQFCQLLEAQSINGISQLTNFLPKQNWKQSSYQTKTTSESFNLRSSRITKRNIKLQRSVNVTKALFRLLNLSRLIFYPHLGTISRIIHGSRWQKKVNFSCTWANKTNTWSLVLMVLMWHFTSAKSKNNTKLIVCLASCCHGITMQGLLLQRWGKRPLTWL